MKLGLFVRARRGFTPAPDLLSLLRQRKKAKKGDPDACAVRLRRPVPCGARNPGRGPKLAAFASLTPLRQSGRVSSRSALSRAALGFCAPRLGIGGTPNSQQPNSPDFNQRAVSWLFGLLPLCAAEKRSLAGQRAQHAFPSDSAQLSERSERSERSEFWAGPAKRASQGTPWRSQGAAHRGLTFWFLLGQAKRNSPAGARPGGLSLRTTSP